MKTNVVSTISIFMTCSNSIPMICCFLVFCIKMLFLVGYGKVTLGKEKSWAKLLSGIGEFVDCTFIILSVGYSYREGVMEVIKDLEW